MEDYRENNRPRPARASGERSYVLFSCTAVILYIINFVLTSLFLALFVDVYIKTESYKYGKCFLRNLSIDEALDDQDDEWSAICGGSMGLISLFLLVEVILVCLGIASIVSGRRFQCPKYIEILVVLICSLTATIFGFFVSFVIHDTNREIDVCDLLPTCEVPNNLYYLDGLCWTIVVLFYVSFMISFIDCLCHLPSKRTKPRLYSDYTDDRWHDQQYLLRDSEARKYYAHD